MVEVASHVDRCDTELVEGWITQPGYPDNKIELEILLGETTLGACKADLFRPDLRDAGIADGNCAFSFKMPSFVPQSEASQLRLRIAGTKLFLDTGLSAAQSAGGRESHSRFGGLWIDRFDWMEQLALKNRRGEISDELSVSIFRFVRDGYIILESAVSADVIDQLNDEIEDVWYAPPPGLQIETFEPDGDMRYIPPDVEFRAGRTKMLDLYAYSSTARQAVASPKVVEFLRAIFDGTPKAFQGLTFWNGSQQAIHKDTAYVKVDSNPMHLAATWLALEDIAPGTGELEYYIGSHRAPDFLFGGSSKWLEANHHEHDRFLKSLHEDAEKYQYTRSSFLAKKGDVLVWHADLAHGGAQIQQPGHTRRSLVTHFTTERDEPFYRRTSQKAGTEQGGCHFISQYSDIVGRYSVTPAQYTSKGSGPLVRPAADAKSSDRRRLAS